MVRRLVSTLSLCALLAVTAIALFVALRSPLKDDIAWLLYVARRWMAGRALYVDVIEVNPPLIIWVSALPVMLADWIGVDTKFVAMPFFVVSVLACAWWTACLLRPRGGLFTRRLPVLAVIGSVLLIVPAGDLGQREHLLVAAMLPYLALFARTLDGGKPPRTAGVLVGILAGLGCALKPFYMSVFVVLECIALTRGVRPWRAMPIAACAAFLAYAGAVAIACPAYLWQAVPMALALYGATDVTFTRLLSDCAVLLAQQAVAAALLWLRRRTMPEHGLMLVLTAFAATATVICFIAGKDWYYHRLPATIATMLALVLWCASERAHRRWRVRLPALAATAAVAVFCFDAVQRMTPAVQEAVAPQDTTEARLEQILRLEHARTYVAFSDWLALGFPVVNETGVAWASRFDSMWALEGEAWRAGTDPAAAKAWPVARWVAADFINGCPDVAVVDTRAATDYIRVLRESSPAFARVWSRYQRIASLGGLDVYRRGRGGCLDVWVAASDPKGG